MTECAQSGSELQNWKLTLAYDGADFQGWQVQPGLPTIQGALQAALGRITGETPLPQGSGRTDAGVHALAQVASFALRAPIPPENLRRALNRTLPPSIRISEARTVRSTFHARHSAIAKTYEYRVFREAICPPFLTRYVYACPWALDLAVLEACARLFEGEHDFQSFAASDPEQRERPSALGGGVPEGTAPTETAAVEQLEQTRAGSPGRVENFPSGAKARCLSGFHGTAEAVPFQSRIHATGPTIRTIFSSAWETRQSEAGELLVYRVRGNGFLHHMVRNLVGTMIDVGRGQVALEAIPGILAARSRSAAGPTAPARGLYLHSVEYPDSAL